MTATTPGRFAPRLSAFPKCYIEDLCGGKMDLFDWIRQSQELGAQGLELYDGFLQERSSSYLAKVRNAIEATGQICSMLCYSSDFTHPDADFRRREVQKQNEAIDLTQALGGTHCRILSGQKRPDVSRQDGIRWVVESIRQALEHAERRQVVLAMENHFKDSFWTWPEFAQQGDVFLEIIDQIDAANPWFGVQYDPSNALVAGDDPIELLEQVKRRVVTMHASDRYLLPGHSLDEMKQQDGTLGYPKFLIHGVTGRGTNDYDAIFGKLREVGFQGWISIEDGMNGMQEMADSIAFLRDKIATFRGEDKHA